MSDNYPALIEFVWRENSYYSNFLAITRPLDLQNATDRQKIANLIDSELKPENLTCDGYLQYAGAEVKARYKALTKAAKELRKLDPSVIFTAWQLQGTIITTLA
jgi:hypothetical protein